MNTYETTIVLPGPKTGHTDQKVRVSAETAEEARKILQQLYGARSVPYIPKKVPA
jgi:hypothetical protein